MILSGSRAGRKKLGSRKQKRETLGGKSSGTPSVKSDGKRSGTPIAAMEDIQAGGEKLSGGGGK